VIRIQEAHPLKQGLSVCLLKTPQKASFSFHALRSNLTVPPLSSSLFQRASGHAPVRLPAAAASACRQVNKNKGAKNRIKNIKEKSFRI